MSLNYIFLGTFQQDLPVGLALCIVPAILGWLAAQAYYKVGNLRASVANLTTENGDLNARVTTLTGETTDLRVKQAELESNLDTKSGQLRKAKDDLMLCESERMALREQISQESVSAGKSAKAPAAAPKPVEPKHTEPILFAGTKYKWDDLKIVEGIGPKIAELLENAGIKTWKELSKTSPDRIREILEAGGPQFNIHDPGTWPDQARLADKSDWDALKKLQDELDAGKAG